MKKFKEKIYGGLTFQKKKFLEIFLKNRIFLPSRYSAKESCKKWFNCALWAKSIKLGKKCISVYVITKMNGNHFLPSSMKQVIRKQKMKNHFHENFLLYDLIHNHIAATWVEILFRVLLGIGALFRVATPHGSHSTPYNVQKLSKRGAKTWEHMFAENNYGPANIFRKIYTKRKNRKFLLFVIILGS